MPPLVYHLFNKSIAGYEVFCRPQDFLRMQMLLKFYQSKPAFVSFSRFLELHTKNSLSALLAFPINKNRTITILAYCLMPTHFHIAVEADSEEFVSKFSNDVLNSYTHYFNFLHNRKGPLWQGRSKKVLCESDEQVLHLTRYIHLNPVTAYLVDKPEEWKWSSYHEYIESNVELPICSFQNRISVEPKNYAYFVNSNIEYQRQLAKQASVAASAPAWM